MANSSLLPALCLGFLSTVPLTLVAQHASAQERRNIDVPHSDSLVASVQCDAQSSIQTKSLAGPANVDASLVVVSDDDGNKNSHGCMSSYFIKTWPPTKAQGLPYGGFFGADDEWNRTLQITLAGFSYEGKEVFGFIKEDGKYPFTVVFRYNIRDGAHKEEKINKLVEEARLAGCGASVKIAGITRSGEIVIEPRKSVQCGRDLRWIILTNGPTASIGSKVTLIPLFQEP